MKNINLLMVDDEKGFLDTIIKRLKKREVNVSGVYSGKDALAFLGDNTSIDAVVLDVKMPEMDGVETLIEIKRQFPLVEVIMLTGHATVGRRGAGGAGRRPLGSAASPPPTAPAVDADPRQTPTSA